MTNNAIIVLGMHRSGTSALTGTLSLLGADPGSSLLPAKEGVNPKGFWEHAEIVSIHERLLEALGSSWHDERPLPDKWWQSAAIAPFRESLRAVLQRDFSRSALWIVKDPRLCRLLPLWLEILDELGCRASFILIARHPVEVARSLARRDRLPESRSCLLWLQYMLDAEKWTRGVSRITVTYDELLSDWPAVMGAVAERLSLPLALDDPARRKQVDEFLEPALRHCVAPEWVGEDAFMRLALAAYHAFLSGLAPERLARDLDEIRQEADGLVQLVAPWTQELQSLWRTRADFAVARDLLADREKRLELMTREVDRVKSSLSWKITKPVRLLAFLLRWVLSAGRLKGRQ